MSPTELTRWIKVVCALAGAMFLAAFPCRGQIREPASACLPPGTNRSIARCTPVTVHYATDRQLGAPKSASVAAYTGNRSIADGLSYGTAIVSIPKSHSLGVLEDLAWYEYSADAEKHVIVQRVTAQTESAFYDSLKSRYSDKEAIVFIHGYATTFDFALRRTAQIAFDLKFKGAAILYSWPSEGSAVKYVIDENNIEWTVPHLKEFLRSLRQRGTFSKIHLIAHSMGNRALLNALKELDGDRANRSSMFDQVILAAPDIDVDLFKRLASAVKANSRRVTLYASTADKAILMSRKVHKYPRAGESGTNIVILPAFIDTIDASKVETELGFAHSLRLPCVNGNFDALTTVYTKFRS